VSDSNPRLRSLREHPDLNQLRRQAKELLAAYRVGDPETVAEVSHHYHGAKPATFALHDAQLVLARTYGLESWPKLKRHAELVTRVDKRVQELRATFAGGNREARVRLLAPAHAKVRFENYNPHAASLSDGDARLLIANEEGYAYWSKYDSFLHLDPTVQDVSRSSLRRLGNGRARSRLDVARESQPSAARRTCRPSQCPADRLECVANRSGPATAKEIGFRISRGVRSSAVATGDVRVSAEHMNTDDQGGVR
jgi:hypothetical protein